MSAVFISYSSQNVKQAERLQRDLEALGHTVWWDRDSIPGGSVWEQKIKEGLDAADVVVVLWSDASAQSKWVKRELTYADERNLPLIPLRLDDTALSLMLKAAQAIDTRPAWGGAIKQLNAALVQDPPVSASPAPPKPNLRERGCRVQVEIIVAVIGAVGVVIAALIGILPNILDKQPPATIDTATPTSTATLTLTETLSITFTPTATATVSPVASSGVTPSATVAIPTTSVTSDTVGQAEFTLENINAWRLAMDSGSNPCPPLSMDNTLTNIAQTQLSDLQTYGFLQLTAEPMLAYRTSAGLTLDELADLRGYTGLILPRVVIADIGSQLTVDDVIGQQVTEICTYTKIGLAQQESLGANKRYWVIVFGTE